MTIKNIEIHSVKLKELFFAAKLSWLRFSLKFKANNKDYSETLRFLETERKVDRFSVLNELIFEAPNNPEFIDILKKQDPECVFEFSCKNEKYFFPTVFSDHFNLLEDIAVLTFKWPEKVFKKSQRKAERIKNNITSDLVENQFYLKDLSTNGFSFFYQGELPESFFQEKNKIAELAIPVAFKKDNQFGFQYYHIKTGFKITRKYKKNDELIFGAQFTDLKPYALSLIYKHLKMRSKEEEFFAKNQYYPKVVLPEVLISV